MNGANSDPQPYSYKRLSLPYDPIITRFTTKDVRFPTSLDHTGSDAMNKDCNYSAAYCILHTSCENPESPTGHGMTFTIGRGNELVCSAMHYYASTLVNKRLSMIVADFGQTWRALVSSDSQLRWVGPEKGVTHLALGAVVNAVWDLWAKVLNKPVWRIVAEMEPEELVRCVDFKYIEDVVTAPEAVEMLAEMKKGKEDRTIEAERNVAVPAYTTSAGWLGYDRNKMRRLLKEAREQGYRHYKLKVGGSLQDDIERLSIAREVLGYNEGAILMIDANQVWSVPQAIDWMSELAKFKPWFIEEPTSPDDVLGHAAIRKSLKRFGIGVATGEMCQNRIMFKQLLQAQAIDVCQVDACRIGGLNEVLAVLLMAKKFGVPIVPHSGGVGLPEYTQHISTIDYVCISGEKSILEYVDHLHEHFLHPSQVANGFYITPKEGGYSVEMKAESLAKFEYPGVEGASWWQSEDAAELMKAKRT